MFVTKTSDRHFNKLQQTKWCQACEILQGQAKPDLEECETYRNIEIVKGVT